MGTTFAEARRLVEAEVRKTWPPKAGKLVTLASGQEDSTHWMVTVGAEEWLVGRNADFAIFDAPAYLVSKETGKVEVIDVLPNLDRLNKMKATP